MKILYITPSFQHPEVRGPHRHYHFIRELSKRHDITLLAMAKFAITPKAMEEMKGYTKSIFTFDVNGTSESKMADKVANLPVVGPKLSHALRVESGKLRMKKKFRQLVQEGVYDLVLFHGKSLFPVIKDLDVLPLVVDFCDATSMRIRTKMRHVGLAKRSVLLMRLAKVKRIEKELIHKTPHIAFISNRDRKAVTNAEKLSEVIPIGVDHGYWKRRTKEFQPNSIIFTGVMDYAPNHAAAMHLVERILPKLKPRIPNLEVLIVGRDPRQELVQKSKQIPEVTLTGFVDDMRAYLERAAVFAAPLLYASGIQNKILESMAMEVPVVTTSIGAEGLQIDGSGRAPLLQADDDDEFADCIVKLLANEQKRSRLALESRRFVETHFDWTRSSLKLEKLCEHAVNGLRRQNHDN